MRCEEHDLRAVVGEGGGHLWMTHPCGYGEEVPDESSLEDLAIVATDHRCCDHLGGCVWVQDERPTHYHDGTNTYEQRNYRCTRCGRTGYPGTGAPQGKKVWTGPLQVSLSATGSG